MKYLILQTYYNIVHYGYSRGDVVVYGCANRVVREKKTVKSPWEGGERPSAQDLVDLFKNLSIKLPRLCKKCFPVNV